MQDFYWQSTDLPIRPVHSDDAESLLAIYAPFITETAITFETTVPSLEEWTEHIQSTTQKYPWFVWDDGKLQGYAYATNYRLREAYQWSVEVSIYLAKTARQQGIGRKLYQVLLNQLTQLGYVNVYAVITLPNDASVGFHEAFGFRHIALYEQVGWKLGRWHDVGWWHLRINDSSEPPQDLALEPNFDDSTPQ